MAYFKFHEKKYWESSKLTDSKIYPSRENHAHFISCKPPHKNHPKEYFGTTLWFIQITTSVVEKSQISSVAFHLGATVCAIIFPLKECKLSYLPFKGEWEWRAGPDIAHLHLSRAGTLFLGCGATSMMDPRMLLYVTRFPQKSLHILSV